MKKAFLALSLLSTSFLFAQKVSNQLKFTKGQKLEVVTNMNITAQSMMGPSSGTITMTDLYSVNDALPNAITLVKAPKQVKMNFSLGSQEFKLDSDNPKDLNGPLGQPIKEIMNLKPEFTIDLTGKVTHVKKDDKQKKADAPEAGMMAMMMPGMNLASAIPQPGSPSFFQVLPDREVGVSDTWTDSVNLEGNKSITVYKVKDITDKEIILDFEGSGTSASTQDRMGVSIDVNATTKAKGSVIIDKATGIIKQRTSTNTTETTMNFAGREMTSTVKSTSVTNVNVQ